MLIYILENFGFLRIQRRFKPKFPDVGIPRSFDTFSFHLKHAMFSGIAIQVVTRGVLLIRWRPRLVGHCLANPVIAGDSHLQNTNA